jgi:hypothetical protein
MNYLLLTIGLTVVIIILLIAYATVNGSECFVADFIPSQPWIQYPPFGRIPTPQCQHDRSGLMYQSFPTKCFSCEKQAIKWGIPTYLSHPTKCVDCDTQAADQFGWDYAFYGQPNKCFACERNTMTPNPFRAVALEPTPQNFTAPQGPSTFRPTVDPSPP